MSPVQLGRIAVRELIERTELDTAIVDAIVYGTVVPSIQAPNVAREVGLAAGMPPTVPAYTVSRACASANQAIVGGAESILRGQADVVIAGGVEVLSDVPMLLSKRLRDALLAASKAKSLGARARALSGIRPRDLAPVDARHRRAVHRRVHGPERRAHGQGERDHPRGAGPLGAAFPPAGRTRVPRMAG